jgi:hypothetical protein
MIARLITAVWFFAIALMLQGDANQRDNPWALIFDDTNLFGTDGMQPIWVLHADLPPVGD